MKGSFQVGRKPKSMQCTEVQYMYCNKKKEWMNGWIDGKREETYMLEQKT